MSNLESELFQVRNKFSAIQLFVFILTSTCTYIPGVSWSLASVQKNLLFIELKKNTNSERLVVSTSIFRNFEVEENQFKRISNEKEKTLLSTLCLFIHPLAILFIINTYHEAYIRQSFLNTFLNLTILNPSYSLNTSNSF